MLSHSKCWARIEEILRERSGRKDLVLSDYFDYMAGTFICFIIVICLAIGSSVADATKFYCENGSATLAGAGTGGASVISWGD